MQRHKEELPMIGKKKIEEMKAFLGKGTEFEGKLLFTGYVRIDGRFKGEIIGGGTLNIGEGAHVEADIAVDNVLINGEASGNLEVKKRSEIFPKGKLNGNLQTAALVIHEGGLFDGSCRMKSEPLIRAVEKEEMA
jgi:cytoskeletal protein CcmA (bactofilin family)